jgi:hypothetical protein
LPWNEKSSSEIGSRTEGLGNRCLPEERHAPFYCLCHDFNEPQLTAAFDACEVYTDRHVTNRLGGV